MDGSPNIALKTVPPFHEYHFIDADAARAKQLRTLAGNRDDVFVYNDDCNDILLHEVFPRAKYEDYRRAVCLLDPYNIDLKWEVIEAAGKMKSVEMFLNFMIMDINRNALRRNPDKAIQSKIDQLTRLWGDETWFDAAYDTSGNLFGDPEKVSNERFEMVSHCIHSVSKVPLTPMRASAKYVCIEPAFRHTDCTPSGPSQCTKAVRARARLLMASQ